MMRLTVLFVAFAAAACLRLDDSDKEWKERPVAKVLGILKDMQESLQSEADNDQQLYDKIVCWCETNDKEKTKAIADENQQIADLTSAIEEYTAKTQQLTTDIG